MRTKAKSTTLMECCDNIIEPKPKPCIVKDLNYYSISPKLVYIEWKCPDCGTIMQQFVGTIDNRMAVEVYIPLE